MGNKYLQIFQQLKVPTDIYKSSNNKTVPTEIYKSSNKYLQIFQQLKVPTDIYKSSNKYLQIFQQISTNLPTINDTNKNLPVPPYTHVPPSPLPLFPYPTYVTSRSLTLFLTSQ